MRNDCSVHRLNIDLVACNRFTTIVFEIDVYSAPSTILPSLQIPDSAFSVVQRFLPIKLVNDGF